MNAIATILVWFTVTPVKGGNGRHAGWQVRTHGIQTINQAKFRQSTWRRDFATKDEAIAYGKGQGWTLVENWAQAQELAKPVLAERYAAAQAASDARKGKVSVTVNGTTRWVTPEVAAAILTLIEA